MGIREILILRPDKEQAFAHDILEFASRKYNSDATTNWNIMAVHIKDSGAWRNLFNVAKYSGQDQFSWENCDVWSTAWDEATTKGFVHVSNVQRRKELAERIEMVDFDSVIAAKAVNYDVLIFFNDPLVWYNAIGLQMPDYLLYLITHQAMYYIEDWTNSKLVLNNVQPVDDRKVFATLRDFVRSIGADQFKRRYL